VLRWGEAAVSFQALEPGISWWQDTAGGGAFVAYADTGTAWVGVGHPFSPPEERDAVAARFAAAAQAAKRRVVWFGAEGGRQGAQWSAMVVGEQPWFDPRRWAERLGSFRRLREQLRRARAKGVDVRRVAAEELSDGSSLRCEVERLDRLWLASRSMAPMGFVVRLEPFIAPELHRYYVAERCGTVIAFLSLVPIPGRDGWLFEDLVRAPGAPNGTSEVLIDAAMRDIGAEGCGAATLGLAPLVGDSPGWLRAIAQVTRPLYDFQGVARFKRRLHPERWDAVHLVVRRGACGVGSVVELLRAFAGGPLWRFGLRTFAHHPGAIALALALPLVPWTVLLAGVWVAGASSVLGFSPPELGAWVAFDTLLAAALWRAARHPTPALLGLLTAAAGVDGALSLAHLADAGMGEAGWVAAALRMLATAAPVVGTAALAAATALSVGLRSRR
jgi:phosphatidylglycerol lysyltransferase